MAPRAKNAFKLAGSTSRYLDSLITKTEGRYPFPRGDYTPAKPTRLHIRCATELKDLLCLDGDVVNPLRMFAIDLAFSLAEIDKKEHLKVLVDDILTPAVMHVFSEAHQHGRSRVDRKSLTSLVTVLRYAAPYSDYIRRRDVSDILNRALAHDLVAISGAKNETAATQKPGRQRPQLKLV